MSRIHSNLARTSMHNDLIQTEIMNSVKSNTSSTSVLTGTTNSLITSTNNKLDSFSGAINNHEIGDGTVKLQTYCYGHDVTAGKARALKVDSTGRLECNVSDIELHTGDIHLAVDGLEGLQTTANSTLNNIYTRQDDILTSSNAIKLTNDTIASKTSSLQSTNHTDLNNIYTRQDDILTSSNAIKLTNDTIASKTSSLQSTNHTDLDNIYSRQDDILTATNAVKTNTQSVENCVSANKLNVNISSGIGDLASESTLQTIAEFNCDTTDTTITSSVLPSGASTSSLQGGGLPSALSSNNLRVSLKETITVPVSNAVLTSLDNAINSNRVDVNIANGNISGFATDTLQGGGLPSALSTDNLKVSLKETITVPVSNAALTELASALNSDKLDVNISSGNITGFATSANQSTANGHLLALANVVNPAIATATSTTIPNKLDTIETTANAIETKITLLTSSEVKELLSGVTINAGAFSSEFDTENYERVRFFGQTTANTGSDILLMGSNVSGGTYYILGDILRGQTTASTHYVYATGVENLPRYIKIFNKSGSTNYEFTKLYLQGSGGRLGV